MIYPSFSRNFILRIHIDTVHEGKKDWVCNHCGKAYGERGNLRRHLIVCKHKPHPGII